MIIYKKEISDSALKVLVASIKEKKELAFFSEEYILKHAEYLLTHNKKARELLASDISEENLIKNKIYKNLVKEIREKIRLIYGTFITKKYNTREKILENEDIDTLLELHVSTKERAGKYSEIYSTLIEMVKSTPSTVLDLACGFNPLAQQQLLEEVKKVKSSQKKVLYHASDISPEDIAFLKKAYTTFEFEGELFAADLSDEKDISKLESYSCDWCFLFKALDPIEESNENITYKLLPAIKAKYIIVSFPTLTLSRKKMRNPQRSWFEKALVRLEYPFETFETEDEIFYIVSK